MALEGDFPAARALSLTSYVDGREYHALQDTDIAPLPGAVNPFVALAANQADDEPSASMAYRVHVVAGPKPETAAANTLYVEPGAEGEVVVIYRIYLPSDEAFDDAELPPEVRVDGLGGEQACAQLNAQLKPPAGELISVAQYSALRGMPSPASNPPRFRAAFNPQVNLLCAFAGQAEHCRDGDRPPRLDGLYATSHNQYAYTHLDRGLGPVVVLYGRLPRTPSNTPKGTPLEMRYWSLCQSEFFSLTVADCLHDGQLHLDQDDHYVVVTSLPEDRPANASAECGVNYLAWPQHGDGFGVAAPLGQDDPERGFVVMRNLLTAPDFAHAIYRTERQGDEADVMGEYLPQARYLERGVFESLVGCEGAPYQALSAQLR
ncbi:hypothetical protein [Isoalcanivorax beigongshangi]|uniref:Uncharacterized protein n=1 Tax=Isoalcanivorax beigongshangi TaxID=3238810 RepID=A0ABV4AES6_9GAMM